MQSASLFSANLTILRLALRFQYWMKHYNHLDKDRASDNKKLLEWLYQDIGAEHVFNYPTFVNLAMVLHEDFGFETNPPPTDLAFQAAIELFQQILREEQTEPGLFSWTASK